MVDIMGIKNESAMFRFQNLSSVDSIALSAKQESISFLKKKKQKTFVPLDDATYTTGA
jgi:hypothetical protein